MEKEDAPRQMPRLLNIACCIYFGKSNVLTKSGFTITNWNPKEEDFTSKTTACKWKSAFHAWMAIGTWRSDALFFDSTMISN
jgi:hypothetical protein